MKIAKLLINTSVKTLNKVYDYIIPSELENIARLGMRVEVSFGKSTKDEEGIIVKIVELTKEEVEGRKYKLKSIISVLDDVSYIDEKRLQLAKYIAHVYFCNVYDALKLMLPPGTKSKNDSKSLKSKQNTLVRLVKSPDEIYQDIENEVITSAKHIKLLSFLMYNDYVLINDIIDGLGISRAVISTVQKNGYIMLEKVEVKPDILEDIKIELKPKPIPTDEQREVINKIGTKIYDEKYSKCLIHGVTGSGKTEVYLQLIEKVLVQGRKAILLVPEISLTYQTVTRFVSRFGKNIAILHSKMTIAKRKEAYKKIKNGEVDIVIGARSAIFAPIDNLGLVIIDEEHDSSYYSGVTPKYSTKEVAAYICKQNDAVLVLGSATPEISTYYRALNGEYDLFTMKKRAGNATLPEIEIVNMKHDRLIGNTYNISTRLKEEISKNISCGQQTMIFLNRRGYVSYLKCDDCSYIFKCPNCDVAFVYHKTNNLLHCHYCSCVMKNVTCCPKCGSSKISSNSVGTQKIEEEVKELFPGASVIRMDADTTIARDSHQKILDKFKKEKIDILIGTQMISKGHDISNVTLVGILGCDSMLGMDDYLSGEKAFSNILQVSGRAGRSNLKGRVLIQTNDPENYILDAVVKHSYNDFYEKEIEYRKTFGYPPFINIVLFEVSGRNFSYVKEEANRLYDVLVKNNDNLYKVYSPKSPFIQKINNKFRINIIMKSMLDSNSYKKIYEKLNEYELKRKSGVSLTVTKNPTYIG